MDAINQEDLSHGFHKAGGHLKKKKGQNFTCTLLQAARHSPCDLAASKTQPTKLYATRNRRGRAVYREAGLSEGHDCEMTMPTASE